MILPLNPYLTTESRIDLPWLIGELRYASKKIKLVQPDAGLAFEFTPNSIKSQRLVRRSPFTKAPP